MDTSNGETRIKIGLVHKHRPTREVLARALKFKLQAEVTDFSCVEDLLKSSMDYAVFVVYSDLGHKMNGVEGVSAIRSKSAEAFIIGVSNTPYYERKFLPAGANAFLLRSGNEIGELTRMIQNYQSKKAQAGAALR